MSLVTGTRLGPYEILSLLGVGGMGEVYRARDPRLGREVAIKVLPDEVSETRERLSRFEQEARAAGALNHPNIVAVYDVGTYEGISYLVSELLKGMTLRARLNQGPIPPEKVFEYGLQMAQGLAVAHENGIMHRDLKPENLFITTDDRIKILDFGLAKLMTSGAEGSQAETKPATKPGAILGTPGYMSPEQLRTAPTDHRSDIFSLGAILYEMLSARRAFHGDSAMETIAAILKEDPAGFADFREQSRRGVFSLIMNCLQKDPGKRFQSMRDVALALTAIREENPSRIPVQSTESVPPRQPRPRVANHVVSRTRSTTGNTQHLAEYARHVEVYSSLFPDEELSAVLTGLVVHVKSSRDRRLFHLHDASGSVLIEFLRERFPRDDKWALVRKIGVQDRLRVSGSVTRTEQGGLAVSVSSIDKYLPRPQPADSIIPEAALHGGMPRRYFLAQLRQRATSFFAAEGFHQFEAEYLQPGMPEGPLRVRSLGAFFQGYGPPATLAPSPVPLLRELLFVTSTPRVFTIARCFSAAVRDGFTSAESLILCALELGVPRDQLVDRAERALRALLGDPGVTLPSVRPWLEIKEWNRQNCGPTKVPSEIDAPEVHFVEHLPPNNSRAFRIVWPPNVSVAEGHVESLDEAVTLGGFTLHLQRIARVLNPKAQGGRWLMQRQGLEVPDPSEFSKER